MAQVEFTTYPDLSLTVTLRARAGASGSPSPSGYTAVDTAKRSHYVFTVTGLVGEFDVAAAESDGEIAYAGYVQLMDDSASHRCYDYNKDAEVARQLAEALQADVSLSRKMLTNKHTVEPQPDLSTIISVYNDAGDTVIYKIQYWPSGRREVIQL